MLLRQVREYDTVVRTGRIRRVMPTYIEADGPVMPLGSLCSVDTGTGGVKKEPLLAEVIKADERGITLAPFGEIGSVCCGAIVTASRWHAAVPVGGQLLGRCVDPLGGPLDNLGSLGGCEYAAIGGTRASPLDRVSPHDPFVSGIRAIDALLPLGRGQRVGIFAASGVGKTTLLTQIVGQALADVVIVCLVGERGREVESFWTDSLDDMSRARTTLVAATSDQPAAARVRCGNYALALAEYWRDRGRHVLLVIDSVTRLAMAMRETSLAAGEPPTIRAYTPGVFAALPRLVERCGALRGGGAITALMTILSETDDVDDPISETMKSLLDGHIILSRTLAERGHFPAIDVTSSISRMADRVTDGVMLSRARQVMKWISVSESSQMLIDAGMYMRGANPELDEAIDRHPEIRRFLTQERDEFSELAASHDALSRLAGRG